MSKTITTTITVATLGDGDNSSETYSFTNTNGLPPSQVVLATATDVTVSIPSGALGVAIIAPSATSVLHKGIAGDNGIAITAGGFLAYWFASGVTQFVLRQNSGSTQTVTLLWQ